MISCVYLREEESIKCHTMKLRRCAIGGVEFYFFTCNCYLEVPSVLNSGLDTKRYVYALPLVSFLDQPRSVIRPSWLRARGILK